MKIGKEGRFFGSHDRSMVPVLAGENRFVTCREFDKLIEFG